MKGLLVEVVGLLGQLLARGVGVMLRLQYFPEGPQGWVQGCFWGITDGLVFMAFLAVAGPACTGARTKRGECEGDIVFESHSKTMGRRLG